MEQHPVPQQISSYQFRLVGDMTLKQFFELAAGCIVGLITYATPLTAFIKWPIILLSVIAGAAFAFLPLEERPLEVWFIAFFRCIYSPTLFFWKPTEGGVKYFQPETPNNPTTATLPPLPETGLPPSTKPVFETRLEEKEKETLAKISSTVDAVHQTPAPIVPPAATQTVPPPLVSTGSSTVTNSARVLTANEVKPMPKPVEITQKQAVAIPPTPNLTIPKGNAVYVAPQPVVTTTQATFSTSPVTQTFTPQTSQVVAQNAQFSPDAAPPTPPTQPNVIVGQVMDANKKIIEGAILEVKDNQGRPVRALRTNRAGHFLIVTPLMNGSYQITVEKPGFTFKGNNLVADGKIIPPIAILAEPLTFPNQVAQAPAPQATI